MLSGFYKSLLTYIRELRQDSVVSRSHITLNTLYKLYGVDRVDSALSKYWKLTEGR